MRILLLTQHWYPEDRPPQRRWVWLSEMLTADGHDLLVVAPPPPSERRDEKVHPTLFGWVESEAGTNGEIVVRSRIGVDPSISSVMRKLFNQVAVSVGQIFAAFEYCRSSKGRKPDVVVGTVPALPTLFAAHAVSLITGGRLIVDLRDAWPELLTDMAEWDKEIHGQSTQPKLVQTAFLRVARSILTAAIYRSLAHAESILVTTQGHAEVLSEKMDQFPHPPQVHVVRNAYPSTIAPVMRGRTRSAGTLNVLYAGTVGRAQQLTSAIDAVKIARDQYGVQVNLRIIGGGAGWAACAARAREADVQVDIRPRVPVEALPEHYEWADTVLVQLSPWPTLHNTIPSKTYELLQIGQHITMVASGVAADLIRRLKAGTPVPPGDPKLLAETWAKLANGNEPLEVSRDGAEWLDEVRNVSTPRTVRAVFGDVL